MNKTDQSKVKYCIQSEKHTLQTTLGLCSLMEHQSLVDIAICCGSSILHAHKIVLAASSSLFREELERNPGIEQVIISGCDFAVIRSLIEFMYCGETIISEELIKYLVAAARLFQMKSLENLSMEYPFSGDHIILPKPQFLSKKPKYPAYPFVTNPSLANPPKSTSHNINCMYKPHKVKRKFRLEAEHQACVKEAQASRLAIANLKKEIASAPQANTFIIEETCTETTVENFIPHTDNTNFVDVDYNGVLQSTTLNADSGKSNIIQLTLQNGLQGLTADKIKNILGSDSNANVEVMFKTNDGNFVTVTEEVLQNLQKDGLQYQVIDENGTIGEIQELRLLSKDNVDKMGDEDMPKDLSVHTDITSPVSNFKYFSTTQLNDDSNELTIEHIGSKDSLMQDSNEDLALTSSDMKPTFEEGQSNVPEGFEVVPNFFPMMKSSTSETNMTNGSDMVDDKSCFAEDLSVSSGKTGATTTGLKFSPDIFFADAEEDTNEPDKKKMCMETKEISS